MSDVAGDAYWEGRYAAGQNERYPWDAIVSFVFRNAPRDRPRGEVTILEVGCGTGANLWFAAREGFRVHGLEGSASAVERARRRFAEEGLAGRFDVADFTRDWPVAEGSVDLVIDRGSLTCVGRDGAARALGEAHRALRAGGLLFFNPYSRRHTSFSAGATGADGLTRDMRAGSMAGIDALRFYDRSDVEALLAGRWRIRAVRHMEEVETGEAGESIHAEWRVIASPAGGGPADGGDG